MCQKGGYSWLLALWHQFHSFVKGKKDTHIPNYNNLCFFFLRKKNLFRKFELDPQCFAFGVTFPIDDDRVCLGRILDSMSMSCQRTATRQECHYSNGKLCVSLGGNIDNHKWYDLSELNWEVNDGKGLLEIWYSMGSKYLMRSNFQSLNWRKFQSSNIFQFQRMRGCI